MKHINEARLESDLSYRFEYLSEFMGFSGEDVAAIHAAAAVLAPLVPALVDAVYERLHRYDATWRHFLPRQHGYEGPVPNTLADLTQDHPLIGYRKTHLASYLSALVTKPYDQKTVAYLDRVGKMHTPLAGAAGLVVLGADECPARLRGRRPDQYDPKPGPGAGAGSENAASLRQAALAAKRPHQPPLPRSGGSMCHRLTAPWP